MATTGDAIEAEPQAFQSLYRRYRPQRFSEVRGQGHVALALRNAVRDGHVAHAYLFSGPRGTGKTSTARILAKALDCENQQGGEPCGTCASCVSITAGTSYDVHELDAASNNGVDAMRDLVARASLSTPGRWKVYIVDEVHMLSTGASNALLKTLEEPPSHVVFVLATTDPQKVLPTIRSRTQHYEFHLIGGEVLGALLDDIARDAGLDLPEGAVQSAVRRAKGSARDALSVLDQVAAMGAVEDGTDEIAELIRAIAAYDSAGALAALHRAVSSGRDPRQLAVDIIERLRTGFLAQLGVAGTPGDGAELTAEEVVEFQALGTARCVRSLELIGSAVVAMRDAPEPRITLDVAIIRCTHPEAETTPEALVERIERIERRLDQTPSVDHSVLPRPVEPHPAPPRAAGRAAAAAVVSTADNASPRDEPLPHDSSGDEPPPYDLPPEDMPVGDPSVAPPRGDRAPTAARTAGELAVDAATDRTRRTPDAAPARPALGAYLRSAPPRRPAEDPTARSSGDSRVFAALGDVGSEADTPSYDDLVLAWGDHVLTGLRPKARAIYQAARFVGTESGFALVALPNEAHLLHAEPLASEIAAALTAHFGRRVRIRLVIDTGQSPLRSAPRTGDDASVGHDDAPTGVGGQPEPSRPDAEGDARPEPDDADFTDTGRPLDADEEAAVSGAGVAWATDLLREAFPGAEEV